MASDPGSAVRGNGARVRGPVSGPVSSAPRLRVLPPMPAACAVEPAWRPGAGAASVRAVVRPVPCRVAGAQAPRLRLTARGRRVLVVLLVLSVAGVAALAGTLGGGGAGRLELMGTSSVIVESGDTLWSIARTVAGERDVREVIDDIQSLNALDSAAIEPGQVLELP